MKGAFIVSAILAAPAWSGSHNFQAGTARPSQNGIEGYLCEPLLVEGREIGWTYADARRPTEIGLVARFCREETLSRAGATPDGSRYGKLQDGWFVVDMTKGTTRPLSLPQLGEFSKPAFCKGYVAYWRTEDPTNYSLVVVDLRKETLIKSVSFGDLHLDPDNLDVLSPVIWDSFCTVATVGDRYVKRTSMQVGRGSLVPPGASVIAQWIVEEDGMGPLKIGMLLQDVGEVLGRPLAVPAGTGQTGCVSIEDGEVEGLEYMFTDGRLARIDVNSSNIRTISGAAVGDTIEQVRERLHAILDATKNLPPGAPAAMIERIRKAQRARLDERPHFYRGAPDVYLTFWTLDHRFAVRFETENGRVSRYYAGKAPEVEFVDGCQ